MMAGAMPSQESVRFIVDVCGTLVRDDTTLGLLHHHFKRNNSSSMRSSLLSAMTSRHSLLRLVFSLLEWLTGKHLLKHVAVWMLRGDTVAALDQSASEYAEFLLKERRVTSVWRLLGGPLDAGNVVLASASLEPIVAALASTIGARHVASSLEQRAGVLTGRYAVDLTGSKVQALTEKYGQAVLAGQVCAISDNFSDRPLLERSARAYVVLHQESHRQRWAGIEATFLKASE
jgi:phosphoserine phosphatase